MKRRVYEIRSTDKDVLIKYLIHCKYLFQLFDIKRIDDIYSVIVDNTIYENINMEFELVRARKVTNNKIYNMRELDENLLPIDWSDKDEK